MWISSKTALCLQPFILQNMLSTTNFCCAGCSGGLARIKSAIDNAYGDGLPVLVLNAGDDLKGTPWDRLSVNGSSTMATLMRQLSISAMVRS